MIEIRNTQVKSKLSELTVKDFQTCSDILEEYPQGSVIEGWLKILEYLGLPKSTVDLITAEELKMFIKNFCQGENYKWEFPNEIEVAGVPHKMKMKNDDIPVKVLMNVEKSIKESKRFVIAEIMAILVTSPEGVFLTPEDKIKSIENDSISKWIPIAAKVAGLLTEKFILLADDRN